ncbi:hypothetical protein Cgig2_015731 [Carnegiea gigantea]|uniref:Uncharacterized protein n=1 Tax=Carnegiea gigantea TaxID=171969 RepID=A0A9Q1JKD4_9CARY|nr:hypothetical protein Cgig2_015759 [Carnegiea gigantea]KAJ8425913.1 hypothetical protein Cgig2_015731 [Carnegiea gigantea]
MDWIHNVLNIVAPPFILLLVCLFLPLFRLPELLISILCSFFFTEDVAHKVVIITGAASGIDEGEILSKVADTCREMGSPHAVTVTADVTDVNDCKRIVDSAISHFGRCKRFTDFFLKKFTFICFYQKNKIKIIHIPVLHIIIVGVIEVDHLDVNFWGSIHITCFAISHLRNIGGKIIVMVSSASWVPMPTLSIYNASKAALVAFYQTLRVEVGSDIHITIVTPGFIKSEMTKGKHLAGDGRMIVDLMYLYLPEHGALSEIRPTKVKTE